MTKLAAVIAMSVLNNFKQRFDHRRYNGAILLGLRGISVKSHGSADPFALATPLAVPMMRPRTASSSGSPRALQR